MKRPLSLLDPREAKAAKAPTGASTPSTRSMDVIDQYAALDVDEVLEPACEPDSDSEASYDSQLTLKLPGAHVKLIHDDADASAFGEDVGQDAGDHGKDGTRSDSAVPAEAPVVVNEAPAAETGTSPAAASLHAAAEGPLDSDEEWMVRVHGMDPEAIKRGRPADWKPKSKKPQRRRCMIKWRLALNLADACCPRPLFRLDLNDMPPGPLECEKILDALAKLAAEQLKTVGEFDVPDVCTIQKKSKPSVSAGKRVIAGREVTVKARTATTILKAYPSRRLRLHVSQTEDF